MPGDSIEAIADPGLCRCERTAFPQMPRMH
jgi:hypothetical protein